MIYLDILSSLKNYRKQGNRVYLSSKVAKAIAEIGVKTSDIAFAFWAGFLKNINSRFETSSSRYSMAKTAHLKLCLKVCDQTISSCTMELF